MYATAALAEQNSLNSSTASYNSFNVGQQNCLQQQQQQLQQHHQMHHQIAVPPLSVVVSQQQFHQQHVFPSSQANQTYMANYSTMLPPSKFNNHPKVSAINVVQNIRYEMCLIVSGESYVCFA